VTGQGTAQRTVVAMARRLPPAVPRLTAELVARYLELMPELQGDDAVQELLAASTSANLNALADALVHGLPTDRAPVPLAAAEYTRRLAQRDAPLESLLRAYRLGEARFLQWWFAELGERGLDAPAVLGAVQEVTSVTAAYVDRVCAELVGIFTDEQERWRRRIDTARAARIRGVLLDPSVDVATAEAVTGRRLRGWHVAAVVWGDPGADSGSLTALAHDALAPICEHPPLVVPADTATVWAWLPARSPDPADVATLGATLETALTAPRRPDVRVALGSPGRGLSGFRASHREALRAQMVAEATDDDRAPRVTTYAAVGLPALLAGDLEALRTWVHRTLGDLARRDEATASLRETARAFLATGGSFVEAAARLHVHKNTVLYRLRRAEETRGRPFTGDRLDVEVALEVCARLGRAVLVPPSR
jgi:hypothetical protein